MNWKLEIANLEFGLRHIESIPELAASTLEEGLDSPSLRILAGITQNDAEEIRKYLLRTINELEIECPSKEQSAWLLIEHYIKQIIENKIDPHAGIHLIIWKIYHNMDWFSENDKFDGGSIGMQRLYGFCVTYDELSESSHRWDKKKTNLELLAELRQEIIEASKEYVQYLAQPQHAGQLGLRPRG
jgi:hypothetical protein